MGLQGPGALKAGLLADNRSKLKQAKQHARELSLAINATKRQIDALKSSEESSSSQVDCFTAQSKSPSGLCAKSSAELREL